MQYQRLVPLAAMVLQGLPDNLSILLCGRRVEPLITQLLAQDDPGFDALLLPGNRCALTGTQGWQTLLAGRGLPAAVTLAWELSAEQELRKIPFFVRGKARRNTELFAQSQGLNVINIDTLYEAKAHYAR